MEHLQRVTEEAIEILLGLTAFTHPAVKNNAENTIKQLKDTEECMAVVGAILSKNTDGELASATKLVVYDLASARNIYSNLTVQLQKAFSILNEWIGLWWNRLSETQQNELQTFVLNLFLSPLIEYGNNARWTKMAVILANVAERQYPQHWSMLVEQFSSVWMEQPPSSVGRVLVSMRSLEFVLTNCFDTDFNSHLPSQRRQEIIAGLRDKLPILLNSIYASIQNCAGTLHSPGLDPTAELQAKTRMLAAMNLLGQVCCLVNTAEEICNGEHPFEGLLIGCLGLGSALYSNTSQGQGVDRGLHLQVGTLDVIRTISQYKITCPQLLERIIQGMVAVSGDVSRCLSVTEQSSDVEDSMQLRRVYTSTVHTLISQHTTLLFGSISNAPQSTLPMNVEQLFKLAVQLLQHPSRRIAGEVLKDWIKVFKEMPADLSLQTNEIGVAVLQEFMKKCRRPLCLDQSLLTSRTNKTMSQRDLEIFQLDEQVFEAEFDDKEDWNDFFSIFKSQMVHLAQAISQRAPFHTIQMLLWCLTEIFSRFNATLSPLESKCVTLDLEVFHVIYVAALALYNSAISEANNLQSEVVISTEISIVNAVRQIIQWNPSDAIMSSERLRLLTYHATFLRRHEQLLYDIYSAVFPIIVSEEQLEGEDVALSTRAGNLVVSLTHTCAEELVASTMLDGLLSTFSNVLGQSSSNTVKTCMRECLVSLSERLDTSLPSQHAAAVFELKTKILNIALSDVLESLKSEASVLFASAEVFLQFVLKTTPSATSNMHALGGNAEAVAALELQQRQVTQHRTTLFTFVSCAKKTSIPASLLPIATFGSLSTADLKRAIPFIEAWEIVLPLVFTSTNTFHSLWKPDIRVIISNMIGDNSKTLLLPGLYDLSHNAGVKLNGVTVQQTPKICNELKDLRLWLYQTLAQACIHRAIYIESLSAQHDGFITQLIEDCNFLENIHLAQLSKVFIELYVVNAPTSSYPILSKFLAGFFNSVLRRLSFAWDTRSDSSFSPVQTNVTLSSLSEQDYFTFLYRHCSVDLGYLQSYCKDGIISSADADSLREGVITDCTKAITELLQAINGLKGTLSIPSASQKPSDDKIEGADSALSRIEWQEAERQSRKLALQSLLTAPEFAHVTKPYVLTLLAMLSIPDSVVCKRCVSIMMVPGGLITRVSTDKRLLPFVAGDVFNTTLHILISQEKWSAGLEWELVDLLLEIFLVLHLGEMPSSNSNSNSNTANNSGDNSGAVATGFTSEAPLRCLISLDGITREKVRTLETELRSVLVKKKRRGAFKDFLAEPMRKIRDARDQAETLQHVQGSNFIPQKACPEINNVKTTIFRYWKNDKRFLDLSQVDNGESFGLAAIFQQ